jgi:hypothetical protein
MLVETLRLAADADDNTVEAALRALVGRLDSRLARKGRAGLSKPGGAVRGRGEAARTAVALHPKEQPS